jgi:hypothetical protein
MKKLVQENLTEEWISTDTGAQLYADYPSQHQLSPEGITDDIKKMVPPATEKLSPEDFEQYVDFLLKLVPKSPVLALTVFKEVIKEHPYLSKKPIGFKTVNPYEPYIEKFMKVFKNLSK